MTLLTPSRVVTRLRHPLKLRRLTVLRSERLSPHFLRVTFGSPDLHDFVSASFDDHVKLVLPLPGRTEPLLPALGADGAPSRPPSSPADGEVRPLMRDYTPRRVDRSAGEIDLEFALHGHGPAADWAAQAQPGQHVGLGGPRGSFVVPLDCPWHLLVGDESALPAIARRLEELPAGVQAIVLIELADPADRRRLDTRADLQLHWLQRPAPGPVGEHVSGLPDAVRGLALPGGAARAEGYAWAAGETRATAAVRKVLVEQHGLVKEQIRAAAYWKQGAAGHHENLGE
jgi:NADPH-dependent ferric siderophore reductase